MTEGQKMATNGPYISLR